MKFGVGRGKRRDPTGKRVQKTLVFWTTMILSFEKNDVCETVCLVLVVAVVCDAWRVGKECVPVLQFPHFALLRHCLPHELR